MNITANLNKIIPALCDRFNWDYTFSYGEPGYSNDQTSWVVLGDYWVRDAEGNLSSLEDNYPRFWQALENAGVQFEWHDEWVMDHETAKAYRCEADSYGWTPSFAYDDNGEMLTPDSDIECWIEYAENNPRVALTENMVPDYDSRLTEAGFVKHDSEYESGLHDRMDDPAEIAKGFAESYGEDASYLFVISGQEQFRTLFSAYIRGDL